MSEQIERSAIIIGDHRNSPRLFLQGKKLSRAGFNWGVKYLMEQSGNDLILRLNAAGSHTVSGRIVKKKKQNHFSYL